LGLKFWQVPPAPASYGRPAAKERELVLDLQFQFPRFAMELMDHADRSIVNLSFEDLLVSYEKGVSHTATVQISLKSLLLEDLQVQLGLN